MKKKYFKNFKKKEFKQNGPDASLESNPQKDAEIPTREYEINPSFQRKAFKDLSFDTITVKVDPAGEVSEGSDPYAILNRTNGIVDAIYPGSDNTAGSIVPQLAQSNDSTFENVPDSFEQEIKINIYYCKTNSKSNADVKANGKGSVNLKMDVPYDDILNTITAEAYYDLPFFKWSVGDNAPIFSDDGALDVLLNYQSVVQTIANIPLRYKVIRSLEKTLKDMSYYNGSGRMNRLFGLLKKSSFVASVKSVSEALMTHYLDEHWFGQVSMLVAIPCRKANDMLNPLIDIIPTYDINENLKVWATYADYQDHKDPIIDMGTFTPLMSEARDFMLKSSPQYLLKLVRSDEFDTNAINTWFNGLTHSLDNIVSLLDEFRTQFADLLVAFKRMAKVGITDWKTGYFLSLDKIDQNYQPKFNKLIYDIVRSCYTGSIDYKYVERTGQWECHDVWDKYLGLASYSYKSGGSVLLTSTRRINREDAPDSLAVPVLFYGTDDYGFPKANILTRKGNEFTLICSRQHDLKSDPQIARTLGRLVPISPLDTDKVLMPTVNLTDVSQSPTTQAWVINLLTNLFPYHEAIVNTNTYNYVANPDAMCFVDVEVADQTNAVETFVRQHSPFRVVKPTLDAVLGFKTKK